MTLAPDGRSVAALARTGGPLFVRTAALRGSLTFTTAVAAQLGAIEVAAHAVAFELWNFLALALDAIAIAGQAIVGKELGAGDGEEATIMSRRMLWIGFVTGIAFGAGVLVLRTVLPHLFSSDQAVLSLSAFLLWFVALMQPVNAIRVRPRRDPHRRRRPALHGVGDGRCVRRARRRAASSSSRSISASDGCGPRSPRSCSLG